MAQGGVEKRGRFRKPLLKICRCIAKPSAAILSDHAALATLWHHQGPNCMLLQICEFNFRDFQKILSRPYALPSDVFALKCELKTTVLADIFKSPLQGHALRFALAGFSNMTAAAITNPVNVVKVRMQLDGALVAGQVRNSKSRLSRSLVSFEAGASCFTEDNCIQSDITWLER